ncbi:MAG: zinc ribbon domain-containing protein [Cyanobacteria bacterium QS_4_48_99]|nr:MAG: zinc ribbon domain-containing protein [Cyanobacteria bacterium QS_4_48_99]
MPQCHRCQQFVDAQAVSCPRCKAPLKAYGHPGIPLHQATGDEFLCDSCLYHEDDTCTLPQRPYAKTCTLYENRFKPESELSSSRSRKLGGIEGFKAWYRRNRGLLILLSILILSFVIAFA